MAESRFDRSGRGTNPEHLLAVGGYAACFESALRAVARRRRLDMGDVAIDSKVLVLAGDDKSYELAVVLAVSLPAVADSDEAADLVRVAHGLCPYSNAINVALSANGRAVEPRSD